MKEKSRRIGESGLPNPNPFVLCSNIDFVLIPFKKQLESLQQCV